jgi:hypothetical protein
MKKKKEKPKSALTKDGGKKLSKFALWWQKHPNGLEGMVIHDMRAVMR